MLSTKRKGSSSHLHPLKTNRHKHSSCSKSSYSKPQAPSANDFSLFSNLPFEMLVHICLSLPDHQSIINASSVCALWNTAIATFSTTIWRETFIRELGQGYGPSKTIDRDWKNDYFLHLKWRSSKRDYKFVDAPQTQDYGTVQIDSFDNTLISGNDICTGVYIFDVDTMYFRKYIDTGKTLMFLALYGDFVLHSIHSKNIEVCELNSNASFQLRGHAGRVSGFVVNRDVVVSGDTAGEVRIWSLSARECTKTIRVCNGDEHGYVGRHGVLSLCASWEEGLVAVVLKEGIKVYNMRTNTCQAVIKQAGLEKVCMTADIIVGITKSAVCYVYEASSGALLCILEEQGEVDSALYVPQVQIYKDFLVTLGKDRRSVVVWGWREKKILFKLCESTQFPQEYEGSHDIMSLRVLKDGSGIIAAGFGYSGYHKWSFKNL